MGRKPLTRFGPNVYSIPTSCGYGFAIHIGGSPPTRSFVNKLIKGPLAASEPNPKVELAKAVAEWTAKG